MFSGNIHMSLTLFCFITCCKKCFSLTRKHSFQFSRRLNFTFALPDSSCSAEIKLISACCTPRRSGRGQRPHPPSRTRGRHYSVGKCIGLKPSKSSRTWSKSTRTCCTTARTGPNLMKTTDKHSATSSRAEIATAWIWLPDSYRTTRTWVTMLSKIFCFLKSPIIKRTNGDIWPALDPCLGK